MSIRISRGFKIAQHLNKGRYEGIEEKGVAFCVVKSSWGVLGKWEVAGAPTSC